MNDLIIERIEAANLLGRGGAGFPVARKWRTVRANSSGNAVVLANGAEGEPLSRKDRTLMAHQPQLVIDGALLAASTVGANDIVFYIGSEHRQALASMRRALSERSEPALKRSKVVEAPAGYVSGEESAAVHYLNTGDARPTVTPPRPFERGVSGRPTLVQNVESLAMAALIAGGQQTDTAAVTISGPLQRAGVYQVSLDATLGHAVQMAGGLNQESQAVLIGGYFGRWLPIQEAWPLSLDPAALKNRGLSFGCGVLHFIPADACAVDASARIISYMAGQSARQCGPCVFGLAAIAQATCRLAQRQPQGGDLERLRRWSAEVPGRGACKHPDGASGLIRSALEVFREDFVAHQQRRCLVRPSTLPVRMPVPEEAVA